MTQIGIFSKPHAPAAHKIVPMLLEWLNERSISVRMDAETAVYAAAGDGGGPEGLPREAVADGCSLVVVLGGDGTLLSAARAVAGREIPLLAVNLGSLGFLTAIKVEDLFPELERAMLGHNKVSKRRMLHIDLVRSGAIVATYEALNDVVITKASIARMIEVEAYVNQHFMCAYRADGLILATPTGSTAYSLSAGGPIMFPVVEAFCLTPICPHTLTNRPVLVPTDVLISIVNRAVDESAYLTVDGQVGEPLHEGDRIDCRRSDFYLHLVRPPQKSFFDVLRQKLKWGEA
jgi:NAD+ kinase